MSRSLPRPCKFDTAPVLIGSQGVAKSAALRVLAVKDEWFTDQPILAQRSQTQMELMEGGWIYEIADLDGMRRAETTYVKAFMSRQFDKSRMAYRHLTEERGRQCVFFATTNDARFLKDETGNRRWWPIATQGMANVAWLRENRDQLWAEANEAALALIRENGMLSYGALALPPELWAVAAVEQEKRMVPDTWLETLRGLVPEKGESARYLSSRLAKEILNVNMHKEYDGWNRLKRIMIDKLGFEHSVTIRTDHGRGPGYFFRSDTDQDPDNPPSASQAAANEAARARKAAEEAAANNDANAAQQAARDAKAAAEKAALIAKHLVQRAAGESAEAKATEKTMTTYRFRPIFTATRPRGRVGVIFGKVKTGWHGQAFLAGG